jgi:hypothetical protein
MFGAIPMMMGNVAQSAMGAKHRKAAKFIVPRSFGQNPIFPSKPINSDT